jgi:hypothetical protein
MAVLFFLVLGQNPEQQFGAARLQLHMAELVNAEKIDASVAGNDLGQLLLVGRLEAVPQCTISHRWLTRRSGRR